MFNIIALSEIALLTVLTLITISQMSTYVARKDKTLTADPVVMRSSADTDIYAVCCWLSGPNKLSRLSWLLTHLCNI